MQRALIVLAFVLVNAMASAQTASPSYTDVIKTCGAEWRERTDKATNKGRDAWNTFRASCVDRKGFVPKRQRTLSADQRVPDKAN